MTEFTPLASFFGGTLIGAAVVTLMMVQGRIAGISGIVGGLLSAPANTEWLWKAAFVAGMVLSPLLLAILTGSMPAITVPVSVPALAVGGFLVGIGVTFGAGCTSGHGVCGLARLSKRSLAATLTFMATAVLTVFITRHLIGA
ncbi:YeeE/YedE family protein [Roseibium sp. RKSG952]|uniref:YeeE/YedE family protein n=1 Tax=Roseibium sp. RKSG952 TaxID=2529384 RepID=UPI0012BC9172|nr:YeeE/YedE thiosulfate transporter family protein [Roseibium sp. RKSG952]MTH97002.1 YeeE/YedE family protein [Roseibium sp. RKSG952]